MASRGFEDLEAWQYSRTVVVETCRATSRFPASEQFCLTSQMRRACVSIGSNIAEGSARGSRKDFARFLSMALGSAAELKSQAINAQDLGFMDQNTATDFIEVIQRMGRMLKALHRSISQPSIINH